MAKKIKRLKFECPECKATLLDCIKDNVTAIIPIYGISEDGDFEYSKIDIDISNGEISHYECLFCSYVLKDEDDNTIQDNLEVVEWIKKQKELKNG